MQPPVIFAVRAFGTFLATRSSARSTRQALEDELDGKGAQLDLVIDFAGVEAMTISFADEFVGRFYTSLAAGDIQIRSAILQGLNDETEETISICLQRRELVAAAMVQNRATLLGGQDLLLDTYLRALELGSFSALELANSLSVTPQNANNRLKRLVNGAALIRTRGVAERGGKEFTYSAPSPLPA